MAYVIITKNWNLAVALTPPYDEGQVTIKQVIELLDNGDIHLIGIRNIAGAQHERKWLYPNGDIIGKAAVQFNSNMTNTKVTVEAQGIQGMIHSKLGTWRAKANAKGHAVSPEKKVKVPVIKEGDVDAIKEAIKNSGMISIEAMQAYINKLSDCAEIGACYKMMRHFETKGGK